MPSWTPRSWARTSRRSHTPSLDQRMKVWAAIHQGPSSAGTARHLAPFVCRQRMALIVRRRLDEGTLGVRPASLDQRLKDPPFFVSKHLLPSPATKAAKTADKPHGSGANGP